MVVIGDDREAHLDGAGAAGHDDVCHRRIGVDEREDALEGVVVERLGVAGLGRAEDEGRAAHQGDDVANGPDVGADGHGANVEAGGHAQGVDLVDDAADHEYEDTAGLVALDGLQSFLSGGGGADHDHEAGDVAGDQRNAQLAHLGVGEVAVVLGALIGGGGAGILAGLDDLGRHGGGHAGIEDGLGAVLAGHHLADLGQSRLQLAQGGDLDAQVGIDAGQEVSRVGHRHRRVFAQLGDDSVQLLFGLEVHFIGTTEYSLKQSHVCLHSFHD